MSQTTKTPIRTQRTTRDVLVRARQLYAANPSHAPFGEFTTQCPVQCLDRAGDLSGGPAIIALAEAAGLEHDAEDFYGSRRLAVIKWNAVATTEEVLAAFDRAIEAAE